MEKIQKTRTGRVAQRWVNEKVERKMADQAGAIAYRQLRELGLSPEAIRNREANHHLVRRTEHLARRKGVPKHRREPTTTGLRTAVYTAHGGPMSIETLRWRAVLSGPEGARLTHTSMAALHDLEPQRGQTMHVTHEGAGWHPPKGVDAHRTTKLPDEDRCEVDGIPGCGVGRTVMDAAPDISADRLDDWLDRAIAINIYDEAEMRRVIADRKTFPGGRLLHEALDRLDIRSGEFVRGFERKTTRLIQQSTLIPAPVVNALVAGRRPDLGFPGTRAIIECDGRDYHRSLAQIISDNAREEELLALGFVILRLRWNQVCYEPERTLERIERFVLANTAPPIPRIAQTPSR